MDLQIANVIASHSNEYSKRFKQYRDESEKVFTPLNSQLGISEKTHLGRVLHAPTLMEKISSILKSDSKQEAQALLELVSGPLLNQALRIVALIEAIIQEDCFEQPINYQKGVDGIFVSKDIHAGKRTYSFRQLFDDPTFTVTTDQQGNPQSINIDIMDNPSRLSFDFKDGQISAFNKHDSCKPHD